MVRTNDVDGIRVVTLDNPPVNALSFALCAELAPVVEAASADAKVKAIVFTGANGIFSGGADVNDFNTEPTPDTKTIRDVIAAMEKSEKTLVAAIDANALGGAFELALACDYRVATKRSRLAFPEIQLGLLPGAGGTQRLPRIVDVQEALQIMLKARRLDASDALAKDILDEIVESASTGSVQAVVDAAVALAKREAGKKRRLSERKAVLPKGVIPAALPFVVSQAHKMVPPEENGGYAAHKLIDAVEAAVALPFKYGLAREYRLFDEVVRSKPSMALRHVFFAERELSKIPGLAGVQPQEIAEAAVIGGGTMGTGIAICFADAGIPVTIVEPIEAQVERAKQTIFGMYAHQVQRGRLTQEEAWKRGQSIGFTSEYAELADCDLVIEAVFESMDVKKEVFSKLDGVVKRSAILASNTSTLDIDAIAAATTHAPQVLGMHFFAPANIMKLLEIVRGKETSMQAIATAFSVGKKMHKVSVLSGNAFGFIGNRMLFDYAREAVALAEEGVPPYRVDAVMKGFGFPMGPFAMFDLSGIDVSWHIARARPDVMTGRTKIVDRLYDMKRLGQKTGAGYYRYEKSVGSGREPIRDESVEALFAQEAKVAGIARRANVSNEEIVQRCVYALVNAGAALLERGIALRPGDEDIVYIYGYGFPPHHGGPMWYADEVGVKNVYETILRFHKDLGPHWEPSPLLAEIARKNGTFAAHGMKEPIHA
ncbi:MAG TPA: 3-hydroxyacyl-CoA dehydrogenase NAD-binding domain-containing protein [Candidatus Tyrphobacter sp.]